MERHEELLCGLLKCALDGKKHNSTGSYTEDEYNMALETAAMHSVLPLLYGTLDGERVDDTAMQAVYQSYHLLFLSKYVINILWESGIDTIVLKGCSTASLYPVPELRKSGDIDLLLENAESAAKARTVLRNAGFRIEKEQHANHHTVYKSPDGIDVELHSLLVEPFDNNRVNKYLEKTRECIFKDACRKNIMGVEMPVLSEPFHAFYLLLHMLQHFLRSGCGLKLICDWAVFWSRDIQKEDKLQFLRLVEESGIYGFARIVTLSCIYYLGLDRNKVSFMLCLENNNGRKASARKDREDAEEFMAEVFEAGEFGKTSPDRMVALRGTGWISYIREFHHQMKLAYPAAGRIIIIWPVLWVMTFAGFLYRNRRLRNVAGSAIIKKAAQRGRIAAKMELFKNID